MKTNTTKSPPNKHKVAKRQWNKWSFKAKCIFNQVYHAMLHNQDAIAGPDAVRATKKVWRVTAWNAAFIAAEETRWLDKFEKDETKCT